jgi:D-alanine transaminase
MPELAYLNGKIRPISETFVPIEDRGYQFGDAVYEFIASYNGKLFCMKEHLDRLEYSMERLLFPKMDRGFIEQAVYELFEQAGIARAGIYIQISRGVAPRNHVWAKDIKLQFLMTVKKAAEIPSKYRKDGIDIITVLDERWLNCDIKTVQILFNSMAKQKAKNLGAFDAIFVSKDGIVREGTSSNFFIVKDGALITHPLTKNILSGITRMVIMDLAHDLRIKVKEKLLLKSDIFSANEAFLSGTLTEILGIKTIDKIPLGIGKPGEITKKLYQALREKAE